MMRIHKQTPAAFNVTKKRLIRFTLTESNGEN